MAPTLLVPTDEQAMIWGIIANPKDDTPRLIYADWLDEHGEPERAEFIRLQITEPVPIGTHAFDYPPRQKSIWGEYCRQWVGIQGNSYHPREFLAAGVDQYSRGFLSTVRLPCAAFCGGEERRACLGEGDGVDETGCRACESTGRTPGLAGELFASHPIERVKFSDLQPWDFDTGEFGWFCEGGPEVVNRATLPRCIIKEMGILVGRRYSTIALAIDALSQAGSTFGRKEAVKHKLVPDEVASAWGI